MYSVNSIIFSWYMMLCQFIFLNWNFYCSFTLNCGVSLPCGYVLELLWNHLKCRAIPPSNFMHFGTKNMVKFLDISILHFKMIYLLTKTLLGRMVVGNHQLSLMNNLMFQCGTLYCSSPLQMSCCCFIK